MTIKGVNFRPTKRGQNSTGVDTDRDLEEAHLINAAYDVHTDDPEFGYRFIADELQAAGLQASGLVLLATTRRWNRSSLFCRRTSSIEAVGTRERGCGR
jgi:hypothetical protein